MGIRRTNSDVIEYTVEKNNIVLDSFKINIKDVGNESQMRCFIRSNLFHLGWKEIGTQDTTVHEIPKFDNLFIY